MKKILTIIIPSYNMQDYLQQCIDSLLVPNLHMVQILIINDGSKDKTSDIAHNYSQKYPESIQVIDKPNGNYGSCINRGLAEAKGKYVKILDADDSFHKDNFREFIQFLATVDCDAVVSNYDIVNEDGSVTEKVRFNLSETATVFILGDEIFNIPQRIFQMHGITYRTENLKMIGYSQTEGISYTDQEWMFIPMLSVEKIAFFKPSLYRYLVGRTGQTVMADTAKHILPLSNIVTRLIEYYATNFEQLYSPAQRFYAENRLIGLTTTIIRKSLLYNEDPRLYSSASLLDTQLFNKTPKIWKSINQDRVKSYIPIDYISIWRKNNYNPHNVIIKGLRQLLNLYHR